MEGGQWCRPCCVALDSSFPALAAGSLGEGLQLDLGQVLIFSEGGFEQIPPSCLVVLWGRPAPGWRVPSRGLEATGSSEPPTSRPGCSVTASCLTVSLDARLVGGLSQTR